MAASWIALVLSLAVVGGGGDVAGLGPVVGVVVGPDGRPAPGAEVVAVGGAWDGEAPAAMGRASAGEGGRFRIEPAPGLATSDRPTLWATLAGFVAASAPVDREALAGRPVRLILGSPSRSTFTVAGPDGRGVAGATVRPRRVAREGGEVPDVVAALAGASTDGEGRAVVTAFRPEEILSVRVEAAGFGVQPRDFGPPGTLGGVGTKGIALVSTGRVSGRVTADDPASVAGLIVHLASTGGGRGGPTSGVAAATTDASGRFEVPAIAAGSLTVRVRPREGSPDLPARVVRRALEAGQGVEVEVPLRRGVKVLGRAVDDRDGRGVAGAVVAVIPTGPFDPSRVRTGDDGRFEVYVPSGLVGYRILKVPAPYLCPPDFAGPRPVEVPPAIARFELPPAALTRGVDVRGRVVDGDGRGVAEARVVASWTLFDGRVRAPRAESATSTADGSFAIGPVAPDAEVAIVASGGELGTDEPVVVRPSEARPALLTVVGPDSVPVGGRVVGPEGRPIAGALVRIWASSPGGSGAIGEGSIVRFDGSDELKTNPDGRFLAPRRLRPDRDYAAIATAPGHRAGRTRAFRPSGPALADFPDLVLELEPGRVAIEGRVVDRAGRPVLGATVRTSDDGPCCRRSTTDGDGRFRIEDVVERPAFLFAEAEGFRFTGRQLDPARGSADLAMTRLDEVPEASMSTHARASTESALARLVMGPYVDRVLAGGDHSTRVRALELLARVDPRRVLALVEARGVGDAWFADHLRHAASCSLVGADADDRMAVVGAIRDAEWRALAALDAADALPASASAEKRERVGQALGDARTIVDPARRVVALARIADRLIDLGDLDRAARLLEEARPVAESLPLATAGGRARVEFAETLARVDPAHALAMTEDLLDPGAFDRCRLRIARGVAARHPAEAARALESLRDPRSLARALPEICHALAPVDPALARRLIDRSRGDDPTLPAYALGMMALAVAEGDPAAATAWLREAFDRLGHLAAPGPAGAGASTAHDPAVVAAALLPVAERIDPRLVPELFWRAVSFHSPRPGSEVGTDALLALLLARYDRLVARVFFRPAADRALAAHEADLAPLFAASALLDPGLAIRLLEALPEAPDLTFHHPKNEARLALAAAFARGTPACWDDATRRLLHLWTEGRPTGE